MRQGSQVRQWALALVALLLAAAPALAQTGALTGTVQAAETGAPLPAAVVQVTTPDGGRVASGLTNQSGRYQITSIPAGQYVVIVSITGFDTGRAEAVSVVSGQTATSNFTLASRAIDLDPVVVSASRRQERALDAPARVEVVTEQEIEVRPAITPADHLRTIPGVDIATSGVQSTNVVARGFNNVFSGSLYMLSDHRIAGVPSLRVNLLHFSPSTNEDLERIEVVLGPGSALYGPNTANGVLHMLTRSPLTSQGTTVSLTGGERSLFQGSFRTAHLINENLGVKLSGQYLQADEWRYTDPVEASEAFLYRDSDPTTRAMLRAQLIAAAGITEAQADARIERMGRRDFDIQRYGGEARADWRISPDATAILSAGTNVASGIELTGLGAGQAEGWRYDYLQLRTTLNRAFAQVYLNRSDAGDTYLLRNGAPIVDRSKLFVAQIQNSGSLWGERQVFTYGLDYFWTIPETEGTINGIYEDEDETREFGGYIQSETALSPRFDLVLAGRLDTHSALPDAIFSPRAAIVFKPTRDQTFRLSFNRAFSTPTSLTQYLDLGSPIPSPGAARLGYSMRIQGTGDRGFTFRQPDGGYLMRSPFTPAAAGGPATLLPAGGAHMFWPAAIQVVAAQAGLPAQLVQALQSIPQAQLAAAVQLNYGAASAGAPQFPLAQLQLDPIAAIRESTSTTLEAGYKGILGQRVLIAADVWWSRRENLVTPLTAATPFVHFDQASTQAFLTAVLTPSMGAQAAATAEALADGIRQVPLGVVSSADVAANGPQVLVTYFNVDDELDLYGTDLSFTALLTDVWSLEASGSLVSDDVFESSGGMRVTLNAPKRKGALAAIYRSERNGFNGEARVRYNAPYPVDSGVYRATECLGDITDDVEPCVGGYSLLDMNVGYRLPQIRGASIQLAIQNLLDAGYRSFPGVPEIGRMALLRLRYDF